MTTEMTNIINAKKKGETMVKRGTKYNPTFWDTAHLLEEDYVMCQWCFKAITFGEIYQIGDWHYCQECGQEVTEENDRRLEE